MKRILKKGLISILIVLILVNFISVNTINVSYAVDPPQENESEEGPGVGEVIGEVIGDVFSGLIGVITWIPRAILMAGLMGINKLITAFAAFGLDGIDGYGLNDAIDPFGISDVAFLSPFHIFFNKIALLDVNFLNFDGVSGTVETFRTAVAGWYYTMRLIACMVLAVILIYIGIRMAISTIASEKAMYKKMLVDWITSLALLFLLHYIMLFTFACNEALIKAIEAVCDESNITNFMGTLEREAFGIQIVEAVGAMILFGIVIGQTLAFLFAYVKRMLTIGFLIMIAPLITITYSIDKIGDGKAQALNTWLKEFVYNVLIQPFHCILFASFASVAMALIEDGANVFHDASIGALILAICCINFIKTGEELVKKIFGFGQASSLTTMAAGAAMTMAAINKGSSAGQAIGSGAAKAKNFLSNNKDKISNATKKLTRKFDDFERNADGSIKRVNGQAVLTDRGRKKAERKASQQTDKERETNRYLQESQDGYAARHQQNYTKAIEQMASHSVKEKVFKAKSGTAKALSNRKEAKKDEKAVALAEKRLAEKGVHRPPNEDEIKSARKQVDAEESAKKEKRAKITGAVGHFAGSVGDFVGDHSQDIAKMMGGFAMATIGMGAGGMSGALIGAKFGSGVVQGYMANTNETLQNDFQALAAASKQLDDNPDVDMEAKAYGLYATAQNGGFDKVEEKLDKILDKISGLTSAQKQEFKNKISMQLLKDPRAVNESYLTNMANQFFTKQDGTVDDTAAKAAFSGMKQYAQLATDAKLAQSITTATGTRTIEQVAMAVSYVNNSTTIEKNNYVNENISVEQHVFNEQEAMRRAEQVAAEGRDRAMSEMGAMQQHTKDIPTPRSDDGDNN